MLQKLKILPLPKARFTPLSLTYLTAFLAFGYILAEWVFIITKPSFLQDAGFPAQAVVLLVSSAALSAASLLTLLPYALAHRISQQSRFTALLGLLALLVPALLLACLALMMVDNFTYTVFQFGIVSTKGVLRAVYAALFVLLAAFLYLRLVSAANFISEMIARRSIRAARVSAAVLLLLTLLLVLVPVLFSISKNEMGFASLGANRRAKLSNILLITADSINADATSVYGSEDKTTPFLEELAKTSLVAENAFSNAQGTIGSLTSILTGRYPMDVRVIESDDFLSEEAARQHLPGILKANGYTTVQLSYSYYADAVRVNIQDGFDEANGKLINERSVNYWLAALLPEKTAIFIQEISTRLVERVSHIFFIRVMRNPYQEVTVAATKLTDTQKLERAFELFETQDQPLFIHVHWMTTHGPTYQVSKQVFSAGKDPQDQEKYDNDFYQDAILDFDQALAGLYADLDQAGTLDNTIIVIASDHSQRWTASRLPLIMPLPWRRSCRRNPRQCPVPGYCPHPAGCASDRAAGLDGWSFAPATDRAESPHLHHIHQQFRAGQDHRKSQLPETCPAFLRIRKNLGGELRSFLSPQFADPEGDQRQNSLLFGHLSEPGISAR